VVASPEAIARGRNVAQRFGLFRREYVSADRDTRHIAERVERINPHLLQCYPSHLLLLAEVVNRARLSRLSRIISAGELLTDEARSRIEDAFGVPVSNYYGLKELGMLAWECHEHSGMHINWDLYHVEQLPGSNELVVTLLDDDAMPFVRYNTLDRGRIDFSPCPCGCHFPRIVEIEGRSDDWLVLANGELVPPLRVNFVDFTGHTQAHAYQIRQDRPGHIEILLVPTDTFDMESCGERIRADIDRYLSPDLTFEIMLVEEIQRDPSGKLRSVVSFIKPTSLRFDPGL
jgi:phenylacetate-CoA ligase